jgi:SAM-dependent methyltransferase
LPNEINYGNGVKVQKKELTELNAEWYDVLMIHHVLEHIDEQVETLKQCYRLLKKDGCLLIRIPILGEVYKIYGEKWVQLDAPRHLVLHTLESISILAAKTGFKIRQTIFDSSDFQFLGSELYQRDIPLYDAATHKPNDFVDFFTKDEIERFEKKANVLNEMCTGDQAMFYLEKAD